MPAYFEDKSIDTSSIKYSKIGFRLTKFVKMLYGLDGLQKIKNGQLIVWFNSTELKFDKNFRNYRVHVSTHVNVKHYEKEVIREIPPEMFAEE
jgi:hypothetical protein